MEDYILPELPTKLKVKEKTASATELDSQQSPAAEAPAPSSIRKKRRVRREKKQEFNLETVLLIPGVTKVILSSKTQKNIHCVVGEQVTDENPWKYVPKEELEHNLDHYYTASEFFPMMEEILDYPQERLLVGYLPSENKKFDEFYICLTFEAEETVFEIMENIREQREERLNNSILKTVGQWEALGSDKEIEEETVKDSRPLLEVEVETQYPVRSTRSQFRLRMVENAKDAYAELLTRRITFSNLYRQRLDVGVQVTPVVTSRTVQTTLRGAKHVSTQHKYEYDPVIKLSKEFQENMKSFIENNMNTVDDMLHVNSYINFYKNDYSSLIRDERTTYITGKSLLKEIFCLFDHNLRLGRVIMCLSWHPMWSGTVAIAYSHESPSDYRVSKPNEDEVYMALYEVTPVLLWSFADTLTAKLFLETPRQVTALAFCPYDENILVGGCLNGQIIVWDIKDRLRQVEEEEILTAVQHRYRARMRSLMVWTKTINDPKIVRSTAVSDLAYCHKDEVTTIKWISPYREISKSGKLLNIPDDEKRTSLQFMTSSKDGTVLVWDLLAKPVLREGGYKQRRKLSRLKRRPSALMTDVSPLKELNRIFKPIFKVNVLAPNTNRNLSLTTLSILTTVIQYEQKYPDSNRKFNITERGYYKPILRRDTHPLLNQFIAGTAEGDFVVASWEGFAFNAGEIVNKETCKIQNFGKYHDGPVVSLSRSKIDPDLILTVGGKVFAIWKKNFIGKPVLWRRSEQRYTHGVWNSYRPSMFRICRNDGCVEIWQLKAVSNRCQNLEVLSGGSIMGAYTHPMGMGVNVIGIGDYTSALRLFLILPSLSDSEEDQWYTYKMCEKGIDRKLKFSEWQEEWKKRNAEFIAAKEEQRLEIQRQREEEVQMKKTQTERRETGASERESQLIKREPGCYAKLVEENWKLKEQKRMNAVLLQKRNLDVTMLTKQQLPLLKIEQEEQKLLQKKTQRQNHAQKIFSDTVATLFPEAIEKQPPTTLDLYCGGDPVDIKIDRYKNYQELVQQCEATVNENRYIYHFDWHRVIQAGRERRKWLDGYYDRTNHRNRLMKERQEDEQSSKWSHLWEEPQKGRSSESVNSDIMERDYFE